MGWKQLLAYMTGSVDSGQRLGMRSILIKAHIGFQGLM
jgi:hypothetical protein